MIYLVLSRHGYRQLADSSAWPPTALWASEGVLTASELADLRARGIAVTNFTHKIHPGNFSALSDAIDSIREHHPDQAVWVECVAAA